MEDILKTIIKNKITEVGLQKEAVTLSTLIGLGGDKLERPIKSMRTSLSRTEVGIIAEFKRKSPSKGNINLEAQIKEIIPRYEKAGAGACSILTDTKFFGGSFSDLTSARDLTDLPLLRKDFIIDEYQIYQSRILGADAILLIASCLSIDECNRLAALAHSLNMEVLLEIHTLEELKYMNPNIDMLGVNNRNLGSFHTDINNSHTLIREIKKELERNQRSPLLISESGIKDRNQVKELSEAGFNAFLIGETLMKASDPKVMLTSLIR